MSWAYVCDSKMYRFAVRFCAMVLIAVVGCQKTPHHDPLIEPAKAPEKAPEIADAPKSSKAEKSEATATTVEAEAAKQILVKDVGFKTPESIYYDEKGDVYLVSNINGSPTAADNNGFISKVRPDGTVTALTWIAGGQNNVTLNAPKGMVIKDDILYVADIDMVRKFDMASGAVRGEIAIEKAAFLNDLALGPTGTIYVSDSGLKSGKEGFSAAGTDAVWTIKDNKTEKLLAGPDLNRPNGLLADEGGVWVVTFGGNELYRITDEGKKGDSVNVPSGSLDGLVRTRDGHLLISSWQAKAIFRGQTTGQFTPMLADITSPAGIGYDSKRNCVLVPIFQQDAIHIQPLDAAAATLRKDAPEPEVAASKAENTAAECKPAKKTAEAAAPVNAAE